MSKYSQYVFTKRLKQARREKRITLSQMSHLLMKRSHVTYSNIEHGEVEPRITIMNKISEILGKPVHYFFDINMSGTERMM